MKDFVAGVVIGAVIGGAIVALTTPKNGHELVDEIHDMKMAKMKKIKAKHAQMMEHAGHWHHMPENVEGCKCPSCMTEPV